MTFSLRHAALGLVLALASGFAAAQAASPAGLWKTVDDNTKKEKSLVRIVESGGVYTGKVEKVIDPDSPKDATCKDCTDDRKDKPVVGMTIIRNMKPSAGDKNVFEGGDVLDPNNGKVYSAKLTLVDGGKKLDVRGYIGMPMLGRTQTWQRVE
jgi:uncharacterized protein (DUF2147 family)